MMAKDEIVAEIIATALSDRDGQVAFLRVYMDESGIHDGSPVTCTGILIARPTVWRNWTRKWNVRKAPIKIFHAVDCANLRGEFDGWTEGKRDAYVKNLLPTIPEFDILGTVVGFDNIELEKATKKFPAIPQTIVTPYETCFQIGLMKVLTEVQRVKDARRVAIIHESNEFKGVLMRCFDWLKEQPFVSDKRLSLTFAEKCEAVPLQAADALAYEGNKRIRNIHGKERRAWRAINPSRKRVGLHYFNQEAIEQWVRGLQKRGVRL